MAKFEKALMSWGMMNSEVGFKHYWVGENMIFPSEKSVALLAVIRYFYRR